MRPNEITPDHIAAALKLATPLLWRLAQKISNYYKPTRVIVRNGKHREIDAPLYRLKVLLRRLHRFLQKEAPPHGSAHGGAKGRSCFSAADVHKGRAHLVTRDIQDCYPSISTDLLHRCLLKMGFRSDTAKLLSLMLTHQNRVAQGSPASSDALNLLMYQTDQHISSVAGGTGARNTRTYDDFVLSVSSRSQVAWHSALVERSIESLGLTISERKRCQNGIQSGSGQQRVHNLVVNSKRGVRIPQEQEDEARALAISYVRSARCVDPQSLQALAVKRQRLVGWMHFCRQAKFGPAKEIRRLIDQGDALVRRGLTRDGLSRSDRWWIVAPKRNEARRVANDWRRRRAKLPHGIAPRTAVD